MSQIWILLIVHLITCLILLALVETRLLRCGSEDALLSLLIPVFGPVSTLIRSWVYRRQDKLEASETGVEKLEIDDTTRKSIIELDDDDDVDSVVPITEALIINDPVARRALVKDAMYDVAETLNNEAGNRDAVVPLGEALRVNDPAERRRLIMDVLYTDPAAYIRPLTEAKQNEDSEVVHYAVTALVEIQKKYQQNFETLQAQLAQDPNNGALLRSYQNLLEQYLGSGLLEGSSRREQLLNYLEVLEKRLDNSPAPSLWLKKARVDEELGKDKELMEDAEKLILADPDNEAGYLCTLRACAIRHDRRGIEQAIRQIRMRKIHLSSQGRAEVRFWEDEPEG